MSAIDRRGFLGAVAAAVLVRPSLAPHALSPAELLYTLKRDPYAFIARTTWPMLLDDPRMPKGWSPGTWDAWSRAR